MRSMILIVCLVLVFAKASLPVSAQTITSFQDEKVIDYQLPYPGILPDNPLFFLKRIRDSIQLATVSSPLEKACINLQLADKDMAAGVELSRKGKHKLAEERMTVAQDRVEQASQVIIENSKDITPKDSKEFAITLEKANRKHLEIIELLLKSAPQGQIQVLERLHARNGELAKIISPLLE
ncbi:MAG: DUF5667 domain-containing protein [Patescibacteria group bacterium]|nr:DUF5667 domain-containing protein [Patescibacteria group bacterium]